MTEKAFRFNREAKQRTGGVFPPRVLSLCHGTIRVSAGDVPPAEFLTVFPDIFSHYRLPYVESDKIVQLWRSNPMQFWQNQLNFAVWCATTGCGVSADDHLSNAAPLTASLYRFHVYYTTCRILSAIKTPLPQDQAWRAFDNPYDRRAYERICGEFGVSPNTDWRRHGINNGLGKAYNYWTNMGYHPMGRGEYDPSRMSFTKKTSNDSIHVDYVKQDDGASNAWTTFILDKSEGFTRAGVERLNDSIRTYVWAILGAQAQTRTGILGGGTAFDAQKQFLANVEDAISAPVDLPSAIKRYQDVLQYADSKVDYVFGFGLYMAPSNMELHVGQVGGYNNEIVVATENQTLGLNASLNDTTPPRPFSGDGTSPTPLETARHADQRQKGGGMGMGAIDRPNYDPRGLRSNKHDDEKRALVVAGTLAGLGMLWFISR